MKAKLSLDIMEIEMMPDPFIPGSTLLSCFFPRHVSVSIVTKKFGSPKKLAAVKTELRRQLALHLLWEAREWLDAHPKKRRAKK